MIRLVRRGAALRVVWVLALSMLGLAGGPAVVAADAAPAAAAAPAVAGPEKVTVGAYVNDILGIDLHSHSYRMDIYVWFRWKNPDINPAKTMEFMNSFNPSDHVRSLTYDPPKAQPDGSLYSFVRLQGEFSIKFPLQRYPFDQQTLVVAMEDSETGVAGQQYIADVQPVVMNPRIQLPGFIVGTPRLEIEDYPYATTFGDLAEPNVPAYSRVRVLIPVQRPWFTSAVKAFTPVLLIILCTMLVFFVHPSFAEGRLGVGITALLTLVALQLTSSSTLPEVDYLLMIDKVYFLSYLFIVVALAQVVRTSKLAHDGQFTEALVSDRLALRVLVLCYVAGIATILFTTFR